MDTTSSFALRKKMKKTKDHRKTLAPIAEGTYLVKSIDIKGKLLFIVRKDKKDEHLSRSRVFLATYQPTADELRKDTHPMTSNDINHDYPFFEGKTIAQVRSYPPTEVDIPAKPSKLTEICADLPQNVSYQPYIE